MSQPPDPRRASNLWLKLRSLFGTSARAEIMLHLLTAGPATAGEIARRSGFTARSVLLPLREMALAELFQRDKSVILKHIKRFEPRQ